nr:DMT family protein [Rhodothermus marinus]
MHPLWQTIGLLILSNLFMTFAWYGHLRHLGDRPGTWPCS